MEALEGLKALLEGLKALKANHLIIGLFIEIVIIGVLVTAAWLVVSLLSALVYSAVKNALIRAAEFLRDIAARLLAFGRTAWQHSLASIEAYVGQLSMKWVFLEQDAILFQQLTLAREKVTKVGRQIDDGLGEMRTSMDSFKVAVEALAVPTQSPGVSIGQVSAEGSRAAASKRRTALVVLIVVTPLLLFLLGLNTVMLAKFFESFIDEWLSFRWGIKISTVLGLFFSSLEVALGILLYYASRSNSSGIMPALKQLLYVIMIGCLALIEAYLYYRLSLEMLAGITQNPIASALPAWVDRVWLALLGPVLVIALSATGHELIAATNQYVDAGLEKTQQKLLDEMRRNWTAVTKSGTDLQRRLSEVKDRCSVFLGGLTGESDPNTAAGAVQQTITRLGDALDKATQTRLNPYVKVNDSEAHRIFALLSLKAAALIILTLLFCAVQFMYAPIEVLSNSWVLVAGAIVQAFVVTLAAHKINWQVALLLEGQPAEVLEGSLERWTTAIAVSVLLVAFLYNSALAGLFAVDPFQWVPFLLAMLCLTGFALIGRSIPAVASTGKVWMKSAGAAIVALLSWALSAVFWLAHTICKTVRALLYVLAYPFFLLFWRVKLETVEEPSLERN